MMQPKKSKHRKEFRGKMSGVATRCNTVAFGDYGLKVTETAWITAAQIESARRTITHHTKRGGKLWLRIFPHKPLTHKAAGSKMGSGKGDIDKYTAVVRRGTIVFELGSLDEATAKEAFRKAASKLPVLTRFVVRGAI
ncbi:50S ribosomal protein L16 [Candidatus Collierbacteria bacterium CG17_big_fil_post_rev_8_21_14_2_50_45_7]|uniref:Large ribosomal subunit protein uL16 n=2 Tax=Candidatus Collieribacteriota TaxID=1752725 RepID=A0A2H0WZJ4_9BACT|nr:MAG: 50S ribosomal protein L16 [Candidatus Collierbacteria bacterium CG09_land_8_20_14_0_10_46_12]PIW07650.1 MAG: 50S ribosomal protein L16 [Candidatus Collierbacteria bacterium CG17_big_fil_post_rev_8_21_14_2_50_45_7]